jgi:hypothetical protein
MENQICPKCFNPTPLFPYCNSCAISSQNQQFFNNVFGSMQRDLIPNSQNFIDINKINILRPKSDNNPFDV